MSMSRWKDCYNAISSAKFTGQGEGALLNILEIAYLCLVTYFFIYLLNIFVFVFWGWVTEWNALFIVFRVGFFILEDCQFQKRVCRVLFSYKVKQIRKTQSGVAKKWYFVIQNATWKLIDSFLGNTLAAERVANCLPTGSIWSAILASSQTFVTKSTPIIHPPVQHWLNKCNGAVSEMKDAITHNYHTKYYQLNKWLTVREVEWNKDVHTSYSIWLRGTEIYFLQQHVIPVQMDTQVVMKS